MPTGVHKVTNIPTQRDVEEIKQEYLDSVTNGVEPVIEVEGPAGGPWTVTATFPGSGETEGSFQNRT